uniref:Uncharacterized protein n=1 Tax=Panagrolaimus sp. ES5 TaxID=591445 RepID=A0AC34G8C4_9BILA
MLQVNNQILVKELKFPHCDLDEFFSWYETHECSSPPKEVVEIYKESKKLYEKLKFLDENSEECFNEILKAVNIEFIEDNFEFKLSKDLFNKELWEKYLEFLS